MTQDDVIEMAKEAGIYHAQDSEYHWDGLTDQQIIERTPDSAKDIEWRNRRTFEILERFANLVAAKATEEANAKANASWTLMCKKMVAFEREACAKLCDLGVDTEHPTVKGHIMKNFGASTTLAAAIRARGEKA